MSSKLIPTSRRTHAWAAEGSFLTWNPEQDVSPREAAALSGLDTPVTTHDIFSHDGTPIPRKVETWRDGRHGGIVGKDTYHVIPFVEAAVPFVDAVLLETPTRVISAGKTHNGMREFMVLEWPEHLLVNGEAFSGYMVVQNSHDGSVLFSLAMEKFRVFCTNQLPKINRMAQVKLRHTRNWGTTIEKAREIFAISLAYDEQFEAMVAREMGQPFNTRMFGQVVNEMAPLTDERGLRKEGRSLTMAENARDSLWASFDAADLNNVRFSVFGAKQAVYAYYDWAYSSDKSRALRSLTGSTEQNKVKASRLIDSIAL